MLEILKLSANYGPKPILSEINLTVQPGEVVVLIGPNGAGKSTLIRAASGIHPLRSGTVRIDGFDLRNLTSSQRARRLAVIPQARNLPPAFSVYEVVLLGRTPYLGWMGQASNADHDRVRKALEQTQLTSKASCCVGELSGGEQQRVLLARALAQDTSTLLLDEPTTHLDLQHQAGLLNIVRSLAREAGKAVLMALHDLNLAGLYADRIALLVGGRLKYSGSPSDVLTEPNLSAVYQVPVQVMPHPYYGSPLVLPDGRLPETALRSFDTQPGTPQ